MIFRAGPRLPALLLAAVPLLAETAPAPDSDALLEWMEKAVAANRDELAPLSPDPLLRLQLDVEDFGSWSASADRGAIVSRERWTRRTLSARAVFGDSAFASNRPLHWDEAVPDVAGAQAELPPAFSAPWYDREARQAFLWAFRGARHHFEQLKGERDALIPGETAGLDFAPPGDPSPVLEPPAPALPDSADGERVAGQLRDLSRRFLGRPWLLDSEISLARVVSTKRMAFSDRPASRGATSSCDLVVSLRTLSDDGMVLEQSRTWTTDSFPKSLDTALLARAIDSLLLRLDSLRRAPAGEPYAGPALLEGPAAAVYVHEVLGHRLESHRLRRQTDGQTFLRKRGESVAGEQFSLADDPSLESWDGQALHGNYAVDDDGAKAMRARLIENGKLVGFLDGSSTAAAGDRGNGHGRGQDSRTVSRMGVTVLSTSAPVPYSALRERLVAMAKSRGLPYGLVVRELQGGYTITGRSLPQTFQLQALSAVRVWTDGRPDELVRGLNLSGSPLTSLSQLVGASDRPALFNGYCGAESGWVPVSSIAPDLLFENLEAEIQPARSIPRPALPPPEERP